MKELSRINAKERTYSQYRLRDYDENRTDGYYEIPYLRACHHIPTKLIAFNEAKSKKRYDCGVHFFIDDYRFERIWRHRNSLDFLAKFDCVLTPQFSLYLDMPKAMQIWNIYRSRLIGQIMQDKGYQVIPSLDWALEDSFEFCFDGIEQGGVVATSTVGYMKSKRLQDVWRNGIKEAIKRLKPECVICYGYKIDSDFDFGVEVKFIQAERFE